MKVDPPFAKDSVTQVFAAFPDDVRPALLAVRRLVFAVAADVPGIGPVEETLKWGQPAYLTPQTKAGTTLRLGVTKDHRPAVFVHCQTTILNDVAHAFPDAFGYAGTREAAFSADAVPEVALRHLIVATLTYHRSKKP